MGKQTFIDEFLHDLFDVLPEDLRRTRADLEKNIRAAMNATLKRMDLVTREEFDIQTALLARTRGMLEELNKKVAELENQRMKSGKDKT